MKYKLSKAAGEQYYSTIFKPITEKLEDVADTNRSLVEPIRRLKELSEELSERMLPPPVDDEDEDDDEFEEASEATGEYEGPKMVLYPDKDF